MRSTYPFNSRICSIFCQVSVFMLFFYVYINVELKYVSKITTKETDSFFTNTTRLRLLRN